MAVPPLMQRNDGFPLCMAFCLGFQKLDDYGRALWNEGLY
jgi:hypothetical protein